MEPTATLSSFASGLNELRIQGRFSHPHWMAFLFSGLSASKVSVVSGRALQRDPQLWEARIILDYTKATAVAEELDYVHMALQKPLTADVTAPRLSRFSIQRTADQSLEVVLEGPDQIGFLGRVLGRLSLIMLFPIDMEINTASGMIRDRIVFRGIGGTAPNALAQKSLETMLNTLKTA